VRLEIRYLGNVLSGGIEWLLVTSSRTFARLRNSTGLLRCYTSRVENGHTVPSVDTLEKMARTGSSDVPTLHGRSKIEKPDISFLRSSRQATRNRKPGFAHL
jgi:hypothetical protein